MGSDVLKIVFAHDHCFREATWSDPKGPLDDAASPRIWFEILDLVMSRTFRTFGLCFQLGNSRAVSHVNGVVDLPPGHAFPDPRHD